MPLNQIARYAENLRRLRIWFDAGESDGLTDIPVNAKALSDTLSRIGVSHSFEIYQGDHGNRIRERLEKIVFPLISEALSPGSSPAN
jgi:hypothetical protein